MACMIQAHMLTHAPAMAFSQRQAARRAEGHTAAVKALGEQPGAALSEQPAAALGEQPGAAAPQAQRQALPAHARGGGGGGGGVGEETEMET